MSLFSIIQTLTRAKFEELNMDLFRKTMKPVEQVLKDAGVKKDEIDDVSFSPESSLSNCFAELNLISLRSSLSVVPLVSPKFNNYSRNTLTVKNLPRVSTPMKPLPMVLPFRVVSSPEKKVQEVSS